MAAAGHVPLRRVEGGFRDPGSPPEAVGQPPVCSQLAAAGPLPVAERRPRAPGRGCFAQLGQYCPVGGSSQERGSQLTDSNRGRRWPWKVGVGRAGRDGRRHVGAVTGAETGKPVCGQDAQLVQGLHGAVTQVLGGPWKAILSTDCFGDWGTRLGSLKTMKAEPGLGQQVAGGCPTCSPVDTGSGFQLEAGSSSPGGCGEQSGEGWAEAGSAKGLPGSRVIQGGHTWGSWWSLF